MKKKFTQILHQEDMSIKIAKQLFDYVCNHSDGIDVERLRAAYDVPTDDEHLLSWRRSLFYGTKSKIVSSFKFCKKQIQIKTLFGIRGKSNKILRQGTNAHMLMEFIFDAIPKKEIASKYFKYKSIKKYLIRKLKAVAVVLMEQTTFELAINSIDNSEGERDHYLLAIEKIAIWLDRRYKRLVDKVGPKNVHKYWYPIDSELELYDTKHFRHGLVDAWFKNPDGGYIPVDYKFGKPKRKKNDPDVPNYYMPAITMELLFYKWMIESNTAYYADEKTTKITKWEPRHCPTGEMWYILDTKWGLLSVDFSDCDKYEYDLIELEHTYWKTMDEMAYDFEPKLGWKTNRFRTICNSRKDDGSWKCELRDICALSNSFQEYVEDLVLPKDDGIDWEVD